MKLICKVWPWYASIRMRFMKKLKSGKNIKSCGSPSVESHQYLKLRLGTAYCFILHFCTLPAINLTAIFHKYNQNKKINITISPSLNYMIIIIAPKKQNRFNCAITHDCTTILYGSWYRGLPYLIRVHFGYGSPWNKIVKHHRLLASIIYITSRELFHFSVMHQNLQ